LSGPEIFPEIPAEKRRAELARVFFAGLFYFLVILIRADEQSRRKTVKIIFARVFRRFFEPDLIAVIAVFVQNDPGAVFNDTRRHILDQSVKP